MFLRDREGWSLINKVFVYGTLMSGFTNHHVVSNYISSVEAGEIEGIIYHLPEGYPAVIGGIGRVKGEVITLKEVEEALKAMDLLEDYQEDGENNLYERVVVHVQTAGGSVEAFCYFWPEYNRKYLEEKGIYIESGSWGEFVLKANGGQ